VALSAALLLPLVAAPAGAQALGAGSPDPAIRGFSEAAPGPALAAAAPAAPAPAKRFSLDFVATDLVDVIKALAAQSGANIAVSGKVSGQVTLRLTDVTVEEALTVISKINGLEFAKVDSTYVVGTPEEVKVLVAVPPPPDQPVTKVLGLKYLPPDDAIALLAKAEPQVKCSASPTGGLILTATPAVLDRAATLLAGLDVAPAVSVADRAVYTVKYADCNELVTTLKAIFPELTVTPAPRSATPTVTQGVAGMQGAMAALAAPQLTAQGQAATAAGGTGGAAGAGQQEMSPLTKVVLSGAPATLARALKLCQELDQPPLQVKISATITEVRSDVESRLGINWSDLAGKSSITVGEAAPGDTDPGLTAATIAPHDLKLGKIVRSHLSIGGAINALVTEGKARIMANPTITILDGRQASIHAGDKIYYPQVVGRDINGLIYQATEIDVGVTLKVSPRVGPEGNITLTLVPTISSIADSVFAGYPTITERSTVTTVRVKDGETLAIGGLIRNDETTTVTKVPLLGDIPVIGDLLFKSKVKHPFRSEVVIIITPELVKAESAG
jgi:type II secretory pathway component GspD/PulD (secretin)